MQHSTFEAVKALFKADASLSPPERSRILKLMQQGGAVVFHSHQPPRIIRRKDAAARLGISLRTLDLWAKEGLITKIRMPGRQRACGFSSTEIDALVIGARDAG